LACFLAVVSDFFSCFLRLAALAAFLEASLDLSLTIAAAVGVYAGTDERVGSISKTSGLFEAANRRARAMISPMELDGDDAAVLHRELAPPLKPVV
jgi:hypothetical protein